LLNKKFHLKIADFGFSKNLRTHTHDHIKYDTSIPVGSPEYNVYIFLILNEDLNYKNFFFLHKLNELF